MRNLFPENKVQLAINAGRAPIGFFNYLKDTTVLDIAGTVGFDFVIIDNEHAVLDRETTEKMILAAQLNEVTPFLRVPDIIPYLIRNYLEMGAQGILVPHVNSAADCRRAQQAMRYPPQGKASTCRSIHADGFAPANFKAYLNWVQGAIFVPLIEDPEGVENIEEILDELKPGRDLVMFGKADYAQASGNLKPDGTYNEKVNEAYLKVCKACRIRGIGFMACPSAPASGQTAADVQKVIDDGCTAVVLDTDQLILASAMRRIVGQCMEMKLQ